MMMEFLMTVSRQLSDQEFVDEIASIDSQTNVMDHNASNDINDSQLNSKDNYDNDDRL